MVAIFLLLTFTLAEILLQAESTRVGGPVPAGNGPPLFVDQAPSLAEKVSGLFSPFTLMDGVRRWLGGAKETVNVPKPGGFGAVYALVLLVLVVVCLAGLAARYRKARLS